jgi:predicted dehydrogenase
VKKKLRVIVIGAGSRGQTYTDVMSKLPDQYQVVGVAEPIADRREYVKNKHGIADNCCFDTW